MSYLRCKRGLLVALFGCLFSTVSGRAHAQLDDGMNTAIGEENWHVHPRSRYELFVAGAEALGPIGHVLVPPRWPSDRSYPEFWIVPKSLVGLHDQSIRIQPSKTVDRSENAPKGKEQPHDLSVWSDELDLDETSRGSDVEELVAAAHASSDVTLGGIVREVWQLLPGDHTAPSWQKTAVIYATAHGTSVTETWLLYPSYVYPSPANGITMELRFSRRDPLVDAAGAAQAAIAAEKPRRLILVHIENLGPAAETENLGVSALEGRADAGPAEANAACSMSRVNDATLWQITGAVGALVLASRRQRKRLA